MNWSKTRIPPQRCLNNEGNLVYRREEYDNESCKYIRPKRKEKEKGKLSAIEADKGVQEGNWGCWWWERFTSQGMSV